MRAAVEFRSLPPPRAYPDWSHADHGADEADIVRTIAHEGVIDLQPADRKALQTSQACVTGTEVIERELYAHAFEGLQLRCHGPRVLHQDGFGQLELQITRRQASRGEGIAHSGNEISVP